MTDTDAKESSDSVTSNDTNSHEQNSDNAGHATPDATPDHAAAQEHAGAAPAEASSISDTPASDDHDDASHDGDDADGDAEASADSNGEDGADASPGGEDDPSKKKKRRRRRRKKKGEGEATTTATGAPAPEGAPARPPRKESSHLPFQRAFEGTARRHAFSVGEIVAGRILRIGDEVATVDLFGKALAYTRLHEPRDVPIEPQRPPEDAPVAAAPAEAASAEAAPTEAAPTEISVELPATATDATPTEVAPIDATPIDATPAEVTPIAATAETAAPETAAGPSSDASDDDDDDLDGDHAAHQLRANDDDDEGEPVEGPFVEPAYKLHPEGVEPLKAGEIFRGRVGAVAESGHIAIVNELVDIKATRTALKRARNERARVMGLVFGFNRGGFDVLVYGMRAFCPVSGMSLDVVDDPEPHLGQWGQFHVQTARSGNQGLVVSRRSILEKEARKHARTFLKSLEPGQRVKGRVTQVRDYGLFIDIGGLEGLAHQSELSWERGVKPEDVAKVGDEVEVQILKVHERENKRERHDRVSLSLKALALDPWDQHAEVLQEGQAREGTIVRTAEFGAFVQLVPGIDGLLHITELGKDLKHASDAVSEGDTVVVVIERLDRKARRISLSKLSSAEAERFTKGELTEIERAPKLKPGAHVKVTVTQVGPAGLQVQVGAVVGKRGRGFIPNSEMGTPRGTDHRRQWPPGTEIDVKVMGLDRDGGLRCSRKGFLADEERRAVRDYRKEVGKQGFGTFGDILRQKLGTDQKGTQ